MLCFSSLLQEPEPFPEPEPLPEPEPVYDPVTYAVDSSDGGW